ncbi:MAG: hypothetical protein ACTTHG_01235 [Treponemataceae bacterium]
MSYKKLLYLSYLYISIPFFIFVCTWTRISIAISCGLLFLVAFVWLIFQTKKDIVEDFVFDFKIIFIALIFALIWCFFSGQGGFYYQSDDHWARNAMFRDLVYKSWPVVFTKHSSLLCYYFGFWLFPSLFGKFFLFITGSQYVAFLIARIVLLLCSTFGIFICFLLIYRICNCNSVKKFVFAILFFILFSGCDIIGALLTKRYNNCHIETWASGFQYSSFTTCLFWVYNQTICAWIATLLFLADPRPKNFAFSGLCLLITSPLPFIGIFPIYIVYFVFELVTKNNKLTQIKDVLSIQNIIAPLTIFPIMFLFYSSNSVVESTTYLPSTTDNFVETKTSMFFLTSSSLTKMLINYFAFILFEFVPYYILAFRKNKKSPLFLTMGIGLLIIPFIHLSDSVDFCMRASIPLLVMLMVYTFNNFYEVYTDKNQKIKKNIYILLFCLAVFTPGAEFLRGAKAVVKERKINVSQNNILSDLSIEDIIKDECIKNNFVAYNYKNSKFYKFVMKH